MDHDFWPEKALIPRLEVQNKTSVDGEVDL